LIKDLESFCVLVPKRLICLDNIVLGLGRKWHDGKVVEDKFRTKTEEIVNTSENNIVENSRLKMAEEEAWEFIWNELMENHGWVLDSNNLVGDVDFDAANIIAEYAPVVEFSDPMIGEEVEVSTSVEEGASGEEATRGGVLCQEATGGVTAVKDWWEIRNPNTLVEALGASDEPGDQKEDDVLSVIVVRIRKIVAFQEVDRRSFRILYFSIWDLNIYI